MQPRYLSIIETIVNVFVGFLVSLLLTFYILPLWGFVPTVKQATEITIIYTLASLIRGYTIRRIFKCISGKHCNGPTKI